MNNKNGFVKDFTPILFFIHFRATTVYCLQGFPADSQDVDLNIRVPDCRYSKGEFEVRMPPTILFKNAAF